ncbi:SCARECROW-like [Olea europaea subsp. europaea]|uniref:SCARECROW-like n=1 Tax=Olea europaea subsp. europaea TaxID=158383 RepID=A0A8S0P8K1_OLEEU|nr:SCARECROW-like [Olea europaea subsp. europaea]
MSLSSLLRTCPENETSKVFCDHGGALTLLSKLRTKSIGRKNSGPVQWCNDDEFGDEERVVAYFAKAMASRVINSWIGLVPDLQQHSPFIKFAHFTSNDAILKAFHRQDKVHIIDLDIMQCLQWLALFHILATRIEGLPQVRMTRMGSSMDFLVETGKQLTTFTKRLGMYFELHPMDKKFGSIDLSMLQIRKGEALAVHWLQHSLYDTTGPDRNTMRLLQCLSPRVITLVEQEIGHGGSFLDRLASSLHYYSTIFNSLGAFLDSDDSSRHDVEHCLLY